MKKLYINILIMMASITSLACFETPNSSPRKRQAAVLKNTSDGMDAQTSPAKAAIFSPEVKKTKRKLFPTGYTDTERESGLDERLERLPTITGIINNFNYPIMIGMPGKQAEVLKPGKKLVMEDLQLSRPNYVIMISANNRIHTLRYLSQPNENYFLHLIDDGVESELTYPNTRVIIEIDKKGNFLLKAHAA